MKLQNRLVFSSKSGKISNMIKKLVLEFCGKVQSNEIEIYNEFSLQHELGIFLRAHIGDYKIQFERNVSFFGINETIKKEIDITIFDSARKEKYAIELKFPQNGQYPEQMFSFIKDIKFMEQLKESGFNNTYCLCFVNDPLFYDGDKKDGIYSFFRTKTEISGTIEKPTGKKNETISLNGTYHINWNLGQGGKGYAFYLLEL